jgi:hypothetical protein
MKILLTFIICLSSTNLWAAERKTFSALGSGENSVFVSVKKSSTETGITSSLFEVKEKDKKEIKLSDEIRDREIVGIFTSKKRLFIISQLTSEQGDNPIVFEFTNNKWAKLKELDCKNFSKIEIQKNNLNVFCEIEEKNTDKITNFNKLVSIKNMNVDKKITIPQIESTEGAINAKLVGTPFEWDKLKIMTKVTKEIDVNEF